jgi:hypothetical protein
MKLKKELRAVKEINEQVNIVCKHNLHKYIFMYISMCTVIVGNHQHWSVVVIIHERK